MSPTPTAPLVTGWAALPVLQACDQLVLTGHIYDRNALLATVDPSMWNGRELLDLSDETVRRMYPAKVSAYRVNRFEGEVWRYSVTTGPTLTAPLVSDVQAIEHLELLGLRAPLGRRMLEAARLICEAELGEVFPR